MELENGLESCGGGKEETVPLILEVINSVTCINVSLCCTVQVSAAMLPCLEVPVPVHLRWRMPLTLAVFEVDVPLEQPMIKP